MTKKNGGRNNEPPGTKKSDKRMLVIDIRGLQMIDGNPAQRCFEFAQIRVPGKAIQNQDPNQIIQAIVNQLGIAFAWAVRGDAEPGIVVAGRMPDVGG